MKLYDSLDVDLTYQNCGSQWLIVLRGREEEIELAFNGLYNLMATGGRLTYTDHTRTIATFWSKESRMKKFFFNCCFLKWGNRIKARAFADTQMVMLKSTSMTFFDFQSFRSHDGFTIGSAKAERPDMDFRDAVLAHSFKDNRVDAQV